MLEAEGVPWAVYGTFSGFHIFTNPRKRKIAPSAFDPFACGYEELKAPEPLVASKLRLAMLVGGVDMAGWLGGTTSVAHGDDDLDKTVHAFGEALAMLKREGEL